MISNYIIASTLYMLSGFLDAFDGMAARRFNQGKFLFECLKLPAARESLVFWSN